jgi:hypothetical protein
MPSDCPWKKTVDHKLRQTPEYKQLEHENKVSLGKFFEYFSLQKLLKTFSKLTGLDLKLKDVFHVHDTLYIEKVR